MFGGLLDHDRFPLTTKKAAAEAQRLAVQEARAQATRRAEAVAERKRLRAQQGRRERRAQRRVEREERRAARQAARKERAKALPRDFDEQTVEIIGLVRPYTMTSADKLHALVAAVRHIADQQVPGALVECGVWRGGSMHAVARALMAAGVTDRELYLFDTYEGMTEPTEKDVSAGGAKAADLLAAADRSQHVWAIASVEDVQEGLATLDYPQERFHLVKGPVEETIPESAPEQIALLRLDTDWYESTKHELEHLYDRLVPGGILIIDDYGTWQGSKEATDEFLAKLAHPPLMLRAGRGRVGVKPPE